MMQPEDRVKCSDRWVAHVSTAKTYIAMDLVVNALDRGQRALSRVDILPHVVGNLTPSIGFWERCLEEIEDPVLELPAVVTEC